MVQAALPDSTVLATIVDPSLLGVIAGIWRNTCTAGGVSVRRDPTGWTACTLASGGPPNVATETRLPSFEEAVFCEAGSQMRIVEPRDGTLLLEAREAADVLESWSAFPVTRHPACTAVDVHPLASVAWQAAACDAEPAARSSGPSSSEPRVAQKTARRSASTRQMHSRASKYMFRSMSNLM